MTLDRFSFFGALFLFVLSLFTLFKAPFYIFWLPALAATEGGSYFAVVSVILASGIPGSSWHSVAARTLSILAAILFVTPFLRALPVASALPAQLQKAFGQSAARAVPGAPEQASPLSFITLFKVISSPQVTRQMAIYKRSGGGDLAMDAFRPVWDTALLPAVLIIHGGSWRSGGRGDFEALNRDLAARGYLVVSIDYRLAPDATFPAQRDDVLAALRYMHSRAANLGWDAKNVVLLGRSAGGQIALSAAYARIEPTIRGVIALYTPSDLVFGYEHAGSTRILDSKALISSYLGMPLSQSRAAYEAASPFYQVGPETPPTLMIHGGRDELVSPLHDERLSEQLAAFHRPHYYLKLPWATHGCDAVLRGPSGQLSLYAIEHFLSTVMPS